MSERNAVVVANMPLARKIAWSWSRRVSSVSFDDLQADAFIGLIEAADRFDPAEGVPFGAYAARRIDGAVKDGLRARDHLSRSMRRRIGVDDEGRWANPRPLDAPVLGDEGTTYGELIGGTPDGMYDLIELTHDLAPALRWLAAAHPQKHRVLIEVASGAALAELGRDLGVTESRVSQIRQEAAILLRTAMGGRMSVPTDPEPRKPRRQYCGNLRSDLIAILSQQAVIEAGYGSGVTKGIAKRLSVSPSRVSQVMVELEADGLVHREINGKQLIRINWLGPIEPEQVAS